MLNPRYLSLSRHQIYYFRFPLPHHTRQRGKASHIKVSLNTRCPKEALRLSRLLEYHGYLITQLEGITAMDHGDIIEFLKKYFYELIQEKKDAIHKHGPLPDREARELVQQLYHATRAIERGTDDIEPGEPIDAALQLIIKRFDLDMPEGSDDYRILKSRYKYAYKGYCEKVLSHNQKQLDFPFTTDPAYLKAIKVHPLERIIEQFISETKHTWEERTENLYRGYFSLLVEVLGAGFDVADMNVEVARNMKEILRKLPVNRNKLKETRDFPLQEQLKLEGVTRQSINSINKALSCYGSFCQWAIDNGYMDNNPFAGMRLKEETSKKNKRLPFSEKDIAILLPELAKRQEGLAKKDYQYWGSMLALYTGARRNEIASLTVNDLKEKDGIWYLDITDEDEAKKRVKTGAAVRKVPVHSELIDAGLLDYRQRVKDMRLDNNRLLYEMTYDEKSGWGRKFDWFNNSFLPKLGIKRAKISFHSTRHTVITKLLNAKVDNHIVRALVGHEPDGVTEQVYNHGYDLPILKEAIEQLAYSKA